MCFLAVVLQFPLTTDEHDRKNGSYYHMQMTNTLLASTVVQILSRRNEFISNHTETSQFRHEAVRAQLKVTALCKSTHRRHEADGKQTVRNQYGNLPELGMGAQAYKPGTWEVEAGGSGVQGQQLRI